MKSLPLAVLLSVLVGCSPAPRAVQDGVYASIVAHGDGVVDRLDLSKAPCELKLPAFPEGLETSVGAAVYRMLSRGRVIRGCWVTSPKLPGIATFWEDGDTMLIHPDQLMTPANADKELAKALSNMKGTGV